MADNNPTVKQGAINSKDLKRGVRIRIEGFSGSFHDARFGDDGVSTEPVSAATQKALHEFFGEAVVKEVRPARQEKPAGGKTGEGDGDPDTGGAGNNQPE